MADDELTPPFDSRQPNDTSPWAEITSIHDQLTTPDGPTLPYRLFATRVKSSSPDSEYLMHDPLRYMLDNPGALVNLPDWPDESKISDAGARAAAVAGLFPYDGDDGPRDRNLRDDPRWHITTFLTNHHRKLTKWHASALLIAGKDGFHLMIYKDSHQGDQDLSPRR
jgi:hypothetical protein